VKRKVEEFCDRPPIDVKRKMKEEGKDVEYRHSADQFFKLMSDARFCEVGIVWRMFAATILMGFVG